MGRTKTNFIEQKKPAAYALASNKKEEVSLPQKALYRTKCVRRTHWPQQNKNIKTRTCTRNIFADSIQHSHFYRSGRAAELLDLAFSLLSWGWPRIGPMQHSDFYRVGRGVARFSTAFPLLSWWPRSGSRPSILTSIVVAAAWPPPTMCRQVSLFPCVRATPRPPR